MKRYREHFLPLLDAELRAEQEAKLRHRNNNTSTPRARFNDEFTVGDLVASKQRRLYSLISYSLRSRFGHLHGADKFSKGDLVNIVPQDGREDDDVVEGTVLGRSGSHFVVTVSIGSNGAENMDRFAEEGTILMAECGANSTAYERASSALEAFIAEGPNTPEISRLLVMSFAESREKSVINKRKFYLSENSTWHDGEMPQDSIYKMRDQNGSLREERWDRFAKETVSHVVVSELSAEIKQLLSWLNPSQTTAIKEALRRRLTLIQGPPGTGKTITAAHLITSAVKLGLGPVLACAASNVAADNLLRKVLVASEGSLRIVRIGKVPAIDEDLWEITLESFLENNPVLKKAREFCASGSMRTAELLKLENKVAAKILSQADVVISTCVGCGRKELRERNFSFVVVDEATQATEPDVLIPLSLTIADGTKSQLVLVGDHHQLPPTTLDRKQTTSLEIGLETSLFLRLWQSGIQCQMLNIQYRMHPDIASFPANQFYFRRLRNGISAKDRPLPNSFAIFDTEQVLRSRVIFFNICHGHEEQDCNSYDGLVRMKSFYNKAESEFVVGLLGDFVNKYHLSASAIGVISPYTGQVRLLNECLRKFESLKRIDVSTVDGFQGREKDVIVFSTVRNNDRREVGFLRDWRRLNVAITRARVILIVVGNEKTLASDYNWRSWLKWVTRNGMKSSSSPEIKEKEPKTL